ncbi:MAG TPA: hypothetical protein VIM63_20285 [Rhodoferax sp.]
MYSSPDCLARPAHRLARTSLLASIALALLVTGCASRFGLPGNDAANQPATPTVASSPVPCLAASPVSPVGPVALTAPSATEAILRLLAYADRVLRMQPADLSQEVIRLGDVVRPTEQVQMALVLSQFHQLPELIRAQELLARVLANTGSEAQTLQPLAGLLASRYGEQRRLEDQLEKQTQQTREVQRRLDQTNDRLEALKAIERSLTNRPAPAASAPAASNRGSRAPAP